MVQNRSALVLYIGFRNDALRLAGLLQITAALFACMCGVCVQVKAGQKVALCRCYKSAKFPYCDGSHVKHNEETGDNIAPVVLTGDLPADKRGLEFITKVCVCVVHISLLYIAES